jgi:hypothetical protein
MIDYNELREEAKKKIRIADHMLFVTYPLIKDPKLLIAVIENIFLTLTNTTGYILYYERKFKNVPSFFDTFESKYRVFSEKIVEKYKIDKNYLEFLKKIRNILIAHRRSPMEFSRKDKFVICSSDYKLEVLGVNEIKDYLEKAKSFFSLIDKIIKRNEILERN